MNVRHIIGLASLACVIAGAASAQPATAHRDRADRLAHCLDTTFATNWTPYDDHTILVDASGRSYRITTNQCFGLTAPLPQISTHVRGGSSICNPKDFDLYVSTSGRADRTPCFVQSITELTADQARDFERRHRH